MIYKAFDEDQDRPVVRVTFVLPDTIWADMIYLVGDFNGWDCRSHPFERDREGQWFVSLDLELGRAYQFRYLREGGSWMGEMQADAYVPTSSGQGNFVVVTDPSFKPDHD